MYFAFLGTYTMALVPPALIGIFSVVYHSVYLQVSERVRSTSAAVPFRPDSFLKSFVSRAVGTLNIQ